MENTSTSTTIEQIPQTPTAPVENGKKYFRQSDTTFLFSFFWPIAWIYVLYKNSKALWDKSASQLLLRWGLAYIILFIIFILAAKDVPQLIIPLFHGLLWYYYYEYNQKKRIAYEIPKWSSYHSWWSSFWIGILSTIILLIIFLLWTVIVFFIPKYNSAIDISSFTGVIQNDSLSWEFEALNQAISDIK